MHSLKVFAQSTLGELKDAIVDAVGDDDDEDDEFVGDIPAEPQSENASEGMILKTEGRELECGRAANGEGSIRKAAEDPTLESVRMEFQAVQTSPFFESVLSQLGPEKGVRAKEWSKDGLSVPEMATLSCWTLRQLMPLAAQASQTTKDWQSEPQRLLASFNDRYEALLTEHATLQQRARELSLANADLARSAAQAELWKSAHGTAIARLEELSSENAELKDRIRSAKRLSLDSNPEQLVQKLAQKDAEIRALGEAMERLQEVVDDQSSLMTRCWSLERELEAAKQAKQLDTNVSEATSTHSRPQENETSRVAKDMQTIEESHKKLLARCQHAEKELGETSSALEALLEEKSRRLDDQEHLVDRRLVTSMLALYHDHVSSGQRTLADQVLTQALHILGGVPEETQRSRQQVKAAAAAAEARLAEPLGNAFLDFLEKEAEMEISKAMNAPNVQAPPVSITAQSGSAGPALASQLPPVAPPQVPLPLPK